MYGEGEIIALMFCYIVKVSWLLHCFLLTRTAQTTITSTTVAVGLVQEDA